MYELWARRYETRRYEYITSFSNLDRKYYLMDQLDRSIYYEALIVQGQTCKMYREFEKPKTRVLQKK